MKNTQIANTQFPVVKNIAGSFIVGKDAPVVVRIAEIEDKMESLLQEVMAGTFVGVLINTPVNKKANIAEAQTVVDALNEMVVARLTAEATKQQSKGDVRAMGSKKFANRDEWAAGMSETKGNAEHVVMDRAVRNSNVGRFQSHAITVANQRFMDLGEYQVVVTGIEWFMDDNGNVRPDRYGRYGALYVQLPAGYADVRFYDRNEKKSFWYDFCDFSLNQFKSTFNPMDGSGELILAIKGNYFDGQLEVTLPKSKNENDPKKPYAKMKTRDIRFGMPHTDNNFNLEAALSAYVRFVGSLVTNDAGEYQFDAFTQANPKNRHGIDEHCGTCKFNMYVPGYDGMDESEEGFKNTLNTSDTIEMVQWGQEIPRRFCMVHRELVDLEAVKEINELAAEEHTSYYDEEGNLRYVGPNEILIAGKAVNRYVALKQGTAERCNGCAFYHNNAAKTEQQVSKEKAEGKEYVSKYWSEQARAERMPIQTLVHNGKHEEWVNAYPGEVDNALDFRVYGIGGVVVYGSEEVQEYVNDMGGLSFVGYTEEEDLLNGSAIKIINIVHATCNQFADLKPGTLDRVEKMIEVKPENLSPRVSKRWDGAVERLIKTIAENQGK